MLRDMNAISAAAVFRQQQRDMRRGFVDSVDELLEFTSGLMGENENMRCKAREMQSDISRLRSSVSNFEKIISARDRFGCWLCAKHEREGVAEENSEEKEVLRNENLALRGEIKRLEREVFTLQQDRSPGSSMQGSRLRPAIRSSLRTSDEDMAVKAESRRIRFSHRHSVSSDRRYERASIASSTKKVSLDAPPSPEHKKSPLVSFATTNLVLNAAQAFKSGLRKSRPKQALFSGGSVRPAWAVKFAALERQVSGEEIDELLTIMNQIDVIRSAAETSEELRSIAASMTPVKVGPGDTVCKQGEASLFFMVISDGEFLCECLGAPTRDLGPNDYFGEEIFVHPFPVSSVSVTCTAPDGGTLWAIHTDALRHVLKSSGIRQAQLARETLDCCPKIVRDSMNASQFASICRSATLITVTDESILQRPVESGLVVVVHDASDTPPGSLVLGDGPLSVTRGSRYLSISQREIDSIPPLGVALASLKQHTTSAIVDGIGGRGYTPTTVSPPQEESSDNTLVPHHPLSPSLRPNLTESDVESILLFSLLSLSVRMHLVNRAHFLTIAYDSDEPPIELALGVVLVLNGTAVVQAGSSSHILLDQGHAAGLGQGNTQFTGTVSIDADRHTFDLDGSVPPPLVLAYWPEATIRHALPESIRGERDEASLVSFMKKRKLLIRNPIFQFLPEVSVDRIIKNSSTVKLDHNRSLTASIAAEDSFVVIEGSVNVAGLPVSEFVRLNLGDFWNSEALVNGEDSSAQAPPESTKSEESESSTVVTCYAIRAEIMIISKIDFPTDSELIDRIRDYLQSMRERIELSDVKIGRTIGRGGTAVVKLATVPKESVEDHPVYYALKVIKKKLLEKHDKLGLLKNEKFVMQQLESDFIIKLRATFKDSRNLYFLLELAPGGDLLTILNSFGVLRKDQAQFYIACMIKALEHCHSRGVVYRDLKAENLLVDAQGYLKLADFGVAKKLPPKAGMTTYSLVGTPQFMAPEVILGKGYGLSADLWSLGCCLYEFVMGDLPFSTPPSMAADSQFELFQKILRFNSLDLKWSPEIDADTRNLVCGLLESDPHKRLGGSVGLGIRELETDPFFFNFNWEDFKDRKLVAPFVPEIRPLASAFESSVLDGSGAAEEAVPSVSPALSAVSWTSFDHPRNHMDTTLTWDF